MKSILLIDIGAGPLPVVTPVPDKQSAWFPVLHIAPPLPTPGGVTTSPVADGILVEWADSGIAGAAYVVSRAPAEAGPYAIVHRTTGLRYLHTDNTGEVSWFRVAVELNGRESVPSVPAVDTPVDVSAGIAGADQAAADALAAALAADAKAAQEIIDRQLADAQVLIDAATSATSKVQAEAQARADALLAERLAWEAAVSTETTQRQSADASLAQSISMVSAGSGEQFDSKRIWYFDAELESWTGVVTPAVVDGWLRPGNRAGNTSWIASPGALGIDGGAYRFVKARIKRVGSPAWVGRLYWQTAAEPTWAPARSVVIPEPAFDANGIATVSWDDIGWWPDAVTQIRLDLFGEQTDTNHVLIDWVAIGRPTPGAGVALVQQVEQASIDRDGANALARETLAAQMRGTYTGTDVAQVTQGLVWSERQARVAAVSAEASRTDGIAAGLTTGIGTVDARVTGVELASVTRDNALSGRATAIEARMPTGSDKLANEARVVTAEQAAASATGAVSGRVATVEGRMPTGTDKLANEARVVTAENASVSRDNALSARVGTVEARMPAGGGELATEARVVTAEQAAASAAGANAAAITAVSAKQGQSPDNLVLHGQFEDGTIGSWSKGSAFASGGNTSLRLFTADGVAYEMPGGQYNWIPVTAGDKFDLYAAGIQTAAAGLRFYSAQSLGSLISDGGSALVGTVSPANAVTTAPTGAKWALVVALSQGAVGYLRGFRITRRTPTEQQTATAVQTLTASVDTVTGKVNASHSVVLDVNGNVSGTHSENDGTKSSFSILATVFRVISAVSGMGMEWLDGYLRIWRGSGQVILGFNFGPGDVLLWAGPNVGAAGANKANALFYIDTAGTGYFAGRVLQGVIRSFGSSTAVGNTITTAVATASNGKPVAVKFELLRTTFQAYNGTSATITMGGGQTYVDVSIQRRYGTGAYTEIATQRVFGNVEWFSEPGAGAWIQHRLQNIVQATDVADTRERQYRAVLTNMTFQPHTVANPGTTPAAVTNQYTAVESLE